LTEIFFDLYLDIIVISEIPLTNPSLKDRNNRHHPRNNQITIKGVKIRMRITKITAKKPDVKLRGIDRIDEL
jgi:hypothetical protein